MARVYVSYRPAKSLKTGNLPARCIYFSMGVKESNRPDCLVRRDQDDGERSGSQDAAVERFTIGIKADERFHSIESK